MYTISQIARCLNVDSSVYDTMAMLPLNVLLVAIIVAFVSHILAIIKISQTNWAYTRLYFVNLLSSRQCK